MEPTPKTNLQKEPPSVSEGFGAFVQSVLQWFKDFINLESGLDKEGTIISIRKNTKMRGYSAWLLVCSIMIASLGLDLNSPAVIIGAMLVSPLMSPILGVGLAVGINDKKMLSVSLQQYGVAILITLVTSFIYFSLTPIGELNEQISIRTQPTTLDVLVAFFGGVAGIISGSRKDQSNAIPGVAIATALMPPLCVTGFGLATQRWDIMFNSFYLFFFNAFFVALSTFLIVRMLGFEEKDYATTRERRNTHLLILGFSVLMIIPSTYILLSVLEKSQQQKELTSFVKTHFSGATSCIDYDINDGDTTHIVFKLLGPSIEEDSITRYKNILQSKFKTPILLSFIQASDVDLEEFDLLKLKIRSVEEVAEKMKTTYNEQSNREKDLSLIKEKMDSLKRKNIPLPELAETAKLFLNDIKTMSFAEMQSTDFEQYKEAEPILLVEWKTKKNTSTRKKEEEQLRQLVLQKVEGLDSLKIVSY